LDSIRAAVNNCGKSEVWAVIDSRLIADVKLGRENNNCEIFHSINKAMEAGVKIVVCTPPQLRILRRYHQYDELQIAVLDVYPLWACRDYDQYSITPEGAVLDGADYLMVGDPINQSKDPKAALRHIVKEMQVALDSAHAKQVSNSTTTKGVK